MNIQRTVIASPKRYLPEELCREILLRLPVKSLLRFCCVSKSWLSLIKDPEFSHLHLQTLKNNRDETHLLVVQGKSYYCAVSAVRRSDTFETNSETLLTVGPCCGSERSWSISCYVNGLFLLSRYDEHGNSLMIWNPSIRKFHDIPSFPGTHNSNDRSYVKETDIGLGYDPLLNDYKYVKLVHESRDQLPLVAVYTLGAASWKIIPYQGTEGSQLVYDFSHTRDIIYLLGKIYLIVHQKKSSLCELVSFDVSSEVFCTVSSPYIEGQYFKLVHNGCSSLVLYNYGNKLTMWALESDSPYCTEPCEFKLDVAPHCFYLKKNRDVLVWGNPQIPSFNSRPKLCNLETKEEKILLTQEDDANLKIYHVYGYMESLVLLK